MKHVLIAIAALLCLQMNVNAQNYPALKWAKTNTGAGGADNGTSVAYDASGNMYVAGYFSGEFNPDNTYATTTWILTSNSNSDMYIAKYSSTGSLTWAFGIGGTAFDQLYGIAVDGSGNVYVAGQTNSTTAWDADPSSNTNNVNAAAATNDIFVAKYDGTLTPSNTSFYKWAFTLGGSSGNDQLTSIAVDGSGNIYVAGNTSSSTAWDADPSSNTNTVVSVASHDMFLAKYDGTLTPSNTSFFKWAFTSGGALDDVITDIAVDGSGNVYAAGYTLSPSNWDADPTSGTTYMVSLGNYDIFVAKYDGTLTPSNTSFFKWAFSLGDNSTDMLNGIAVDGSGNVYVAGYTNSTFAWDADPSSNTNIVAAATGGNDMFLAKYDGTLTPSNTSFYKWAFTMGGGKQRPA